MLDEFREVRMTTKAVKNKNRINEAKSLLAIQDLHVWYELRRFGFGHAGYVKAVDGVSFEMKEGETVAVVGESGCGKSSLMKTILGLNIPTTGNVVFDGDDLAKQDGPGLRDYVGQARHPVGCAALRHRVCAAGPVRRASALYECPKNSRRATHRQWRKGQGGTS